MVVFFLYLNTSLKTMIKNDAIRSYRLEDYRWDETELVYRYANGRRVPQSAIFKAIQRDNDRFHQDLKSLYTRMIQGDFSFEDWQRKTTERIKNQHIKMSKFGSGGKLHPITTLEVQDYLRSVEYKHFQKFASDIATGQVSELQAKYRLGLYAHHSKVAYEIGLRNLNRYSKNHVLGRRRLGSCLNHCDDCISYSLLGWQRLEDVVLPGDRCKCGSNCCCSIETTTKVKGDD